MKPPRFCEWLAAWSCIALLGLSRGTICAQTLDTFNPGANSNVNALAIQPDGKILVGGDFTNLGGQSRTYLGRLNVDGTLDTGFTIAANNSVTCLAVQADGRILVGGTFTTLGGSSRAGLGRLNSGTSLDSIFSASLILSSGTASVSAFAIQPDGNIIVAGLFNNVSASPRTNLARLSGLFGSADSGFNPGIASISQQINSVVIQPDGKIVIGGLFNTIRGQACTNLARLNSNGTLDTNFQAAASGGAVYCLALQPDGKILVGGTFTNLVDQVCNSLGRLNLDGSFDGTFNGQASGAVYSLALQTDGKILVGGSFTNLAGQPCNYLGRLTAIGALEATFSAPASTNVLALVIQSDGKVIAGGAFTNLSGQARSRIARLNNTSGPSQSLTFNGATVNWLRGGTGPEFSRTTFEFSTNGSAYFNLTAGSRVAGGWQLAGLSLPANAAVRGRGYFTSGKQNGSGSLIETNFGPPVIVTQPSSRTVNATFAGSFTISASSGTALSYQWCKYGANIPGATTTLLSLFNVLGADAGDYTCAVANNMGAVTSRVATLTVIDPYISQSPANTNADLGGTAVFYVNAQGTAPLAYQWRINGSNIPGETASSLALGNVQNSHAGSLIDVLVSSPFGSATSAPAILSVNLAAVDDFDAGPITYGADVYSLCLQPDGKTVIGGAFQKVGDYWLDGIARLSTNGAPEPSFNPPAGCCFGMPSLALQTNGQILVAGQVQNWLARLNINGSWDTAFNPVITGACASVNCVALQPDGKLVVGGSFTQLGGLPCTNLGRLFPDGTLDTNFHTATASGCSKVRCVALQPDGKILFGGELGQVNTSIGRLNSDGTPDSGFFSWSPGSLYGPNAILVQPDGKILVAAGFARTGYTDFLGRLNQDGSLDATFSPRVTWSGTVGYAVQSLALQTDGRILLGGQFTTVGGYPRQYLARLNNDGSVDTTFSPVPDGEVYCVGLQQDGKIFVGGHFLALGGHPRNYIGRLYNSTAAGQLVSFDGSTLSWQRTGSSPEVWRTTAELCTNGVSWANLGAGVRIPGGWQWTGLQLPANAVVRTRGFAIGGQSEASSWYVESTLTLNAQSPPRIVVGNSHFGYSSNSFGFDIAGLQGQILVVEGSTNLNDWERLATNTIASSPLHFNDVNAGSFPARFYRARLY